MDMSHMILLLIVHYMMFINIANIEYKTNVFVDE